MSGLSTFELFDHLKFVFIFASEAKAAPGPDVPLIFVQFQLFGENYTELHNFFPEFPDYVNTPIPFSQQSQRHALGEHANTFFFSNVYFGANFEQRKI